MNPNTNQYKKSIEKVKTKIKLNSIEAQMVSKCERFENQKKKKFKNVSRHDKKNKYHDSVH